MASEQEYILKTNDLTFILINHSILKFEPMITGFQKEIAALEADLRHDAFNAQDVKKGKYDRSRRMFYAQFHIISLRDNVDKKLYFLKTLTKRQKKFSD